MFTHRTILHIGAPKTGSSTLQSTFRKAHADLAKHGVLYPLNPGGYLFPSHKILASEFRPNEKYGRDLKTLESMANKRNKLVSLQTEFRKYLSEQLSDVKPHTLVLSAEHFCTPALQTQHLKEFLEAFGGTDVEVVMYARQPSKRFASFVQQHLKAAWSLPTSRSNTLKVVHKYKEILPLSAINVIPFHRENLHCGDIVADFSRRFLNDVPVRALPTERNVSLSSEAMVISAAYRRAFHWKDDNVQTPDSRKLVKLLMRADRTVGAPKPQLREGIAERIDYSCLDPLILRSTVGLEFPRFDYERLERGELAQPLSPGLGIDELFVINREILAELAIHVKRRAAKLNWTALEKWVDKNIDTMVSLATGRKETNT